MYKQNKTNSNKLHSNAHKKLKQTGSPELRGRLPRGAVANITQSDHLKSAQIDHRWSVESDHL
jgi:hypothetical protein